MTEDGKSEDEAMEIGIKKAAELAGDRKPFMSGSVVDVEDARSAAENWMRNAGVEVREVSFVTFGGKWMPLGKDVDQVVAVKEMIGFRFSGKPPKSKMSRGIALIVREHFVSNRFQPMAGGPGASASWHILQNGL